MDSLLEKIEGLKKDAQLLKRTCKCGKNNIDTPTPPGKRTRRFSNGIPPTNESPVQNGTIEGCKFQFEGAEDGDWVSAFKAEAGPWAGAPLVVLSLFDGLGGIWQALTNLGIPFRGYSSEVSKEAIQVVKARHPSVKHVGDVTKLQLSAIPDKVDLVVGGFPCQDLTVMGKKEGLHGSRSKLFFDLLRVLQIFKPKWFLVENVASMSWVDREEITRHLKVPALELDSQEITASKRRRLYWTNIPHPPRLPRLRDHPSTSLQSCLEDALAPDQKCGVILCSNMYKGSTVRLELVLDSETKTPRYMKPTEVEVLMGYPRHYTDVVVREAKKQVARSPMKKKVPTPSPVERSSTRELRKTRTSREFFEPEVWETKITRQESLKDIHRWSLLGNTFSVKVITYLSSPLLKRSIRSQGKPVQYVGSVKEEELSAMEPGDVWALFNENGRPNWYALIKSRTGDRFSPVPSAKNKRNVSKLPLKIELQYLEMTPTYLKDEVDEWNPRRGAGLLKLRQVADMQDSWLAFSHRVTSFIKFENSYFVYPGNNEVWAICHAETLCRYFVYVVESTICCEKLEADKPGQEGFFARCLLLQRTTEHETFRKTSTELEFIDIQPFEFRVPFYLKHEATLLKVEVSGVKSRKSMGADREAAPGYRRRGKGRESDEDDDDDLIDEDVDEAIADEAIADEAIADEAIVDVDEAIVALDEAIVGLDEAIVDVNEDLDALPGGVNDSAPVGVESSNGGLPSLIELPCKVT